MSRLNSTAKKAPPKGYFYEDYEKAIEACLGHGLKASLEKSSIEWRNILQETLFELPENINNLAKYATGVPEVLNILKLILVLQNQKFYQYILIQN